MAPTNRGFIMLSFLRLFESPWIQEEGGVRIWVDTFAGITRAEVLATVEIVAWPFPLAR
jgi:hypothetical protein